MISSHTPGGTPAARTLVTGGNGFVGRALVALLASDAMSAGRTDEIVASDIAHAPDASGANVVRHTGPLTDPELLGEVAAGRFDRIVHLATVAGAGSMQFDFGRETNLVATQSLLEAARRPERPPRFVYASSVGVFGPPLPLVVDDDTLPVPTNSYGTHKLIGELLVSDYTRAGLIDGLALRLPGIVARPEGSGTMLSAFLSDVFHAARAGRPFDLPLASEDATWVMSLSCLLPNLRRALEISARDLPARRYWTLPALLLRMGDLVEELRRAYGADHVGGIRFRPQAQAQAMFAQVPLRATGAERLGFCGDGTAARFVRNVIADGAAPRPTTVVA